MSFVSTASTLNIGDLSSNTVNITQATTLNLGKTNGNVNFLTTNPPTSNATQPAATDSSTKIPTTAWVQSAISYTTQSFTDSGTTVTPSGCRFVDIQVIGYGGLAGTSSFVYYGGSGSGGNMAIISGASMEGGLTLTFTFDSTSIIDSSTNTGFVSVEYTNAAGSLVNIAKVYNGNRGGNASPTIVGGGASVNTTPSELNNNFGTWFSATGTAGVAGTDNPPALAGTNRACPRGTFSWGNGKVGTGQRTTSQAQGSGIVVITYHKD